MGLIGKSALPFILGLAVGVVFNDQIRQGWQMLRGAVPQIPDIPSFGAPTPAPEPVAPVDTNAGNSSAYAYKADFDREYSSFNETTNNGIHWS